MRRAAKASRIPSAEFGSSRPSGGKPTWLFVASSNVSTTGERPFGTSSRPGDEIRRAHRVEAVAPEPRQLGAELPGGQVVGASVRADLVVHQHGHDAELVRLQRLGRAGPASVASGRRPCIASVGSAAAVYVTAGIPEQVLVDARVAGAAGSRRRPAAGRSRLPSEKSWSHGTSARAGAADVLLEVLERALDDLVRLPVRVRDAVLAVCPVRGVDHRRDVVDVDAIIGMFWATSVGRVAATPKTDAPR